MPRTPMLRAVLDAIRAVRGAAAAGIPPAEFAALRRETLTRRRMLRLSASAAAAALVGGCAAPRGGGGGAGGARVAIVGAGIAGLHCAWRLRRLGIEAEVYEASRRTGGRILSDRSTFGPQSCELGAELVDTPHATMRDLGREFGLPLLDFTTDDPALAPWVAFVGGRRLPEAEVLEGFAPVADAVERALAGLADPGKGVTHADPNGGEALDRTSLREWLEGSGAPAPVRAFLDVAYETEYGLPTGESSALNFLLLVSTERKRLEIFGESDERYRFADGNDAVPAGLAGGLAPGQVRLGERLAAVRRAPDGRLSLSFEGEGGTRDVPADQAVLAVPFSLLRSVDLDLDLPPAKRRAIAELGYGTNAKVMAGFRERTWRAQGSNGEVFTDLPFQCCWETSRLQPGAGGILTNFTGGARGVAAGLGTGAERGREFAEGLDRVFPGAAAAADGRVARMHWPSFRWTLGSYASYRVGQYAAFAGEEFPPVGNLHFAGEHASADFQGFMEGGALTGAMAADAVAEALGVDARAAAAPGPETRILARARRGRPQLSN